jgi:hypothetical protein
VTRQPQEEDRQPAREIPRLIKPGLKAPASRRDPHMHGPPDRFPIGSSAKNLAMVAHAGWNAVRTGAFFHALT